MTAIAVLVFSALFFGRMTMRLLRVTPVNRGEGVLHALGLGLGVWCLLLFGMGHAHLFHRWLLISLSCAGAAAGAVMEVRALIGRRAGMRLLPQMSPTALILLAATGLMAVVALISCYAPVTGGIRNDEICTHLSIPREWLLRHGFDILPWAISYQAGNAHLLFLLASCFEPEAGPRAVSWLSYVLCVASVYRLARGFLAREGAVIAAAITALNPLVFRGAAVAFVDLESTLYVLLPLCALAAWRRDRKTGWLVAAAIYMGAGIGIKPTNIVYSLVTMAVCAGAWILERKNMRRAVAATALLALVTALAALPWPARNLLLTGSPVFPPPLALYNISPVKPILNVPTPFSRAEIQGYYDYCLSRYGDYRRTPLNLLRLPWDATMTPQRFQIGDSMGTLTLSLLPLLLLAFPLPGMVWLLLVFCALSGVLLYFGVLPEARYYIGLLAALSPALAYAFASLDKKGGVASSAVRVVLWVNVVFCLMVGARVFNTPAMAALSPRWRDAMRDTAAPFHETFDYIRSHNIATVRVCYPSQILYYLNAGYIVDPTAMTIPAVRDSMYILDIDYSQTLQRDVALRTGDYCFDKTAAQARLVYQGPDARLYLRTPSDAPPVEKERSP